MCCVMVTQQLDEAKVKAQAHTKEKKGSEARVADPEIKHNPVNGVLTINEYDMSDALVTAIEKYKAVVPGVKLKHADTPFIDENLLPDGQELSGPEEAGRLAPIASPVLMSILYAARLARFDLLRPVCALASCVSRWTINCDRMLHKLICYIDTTKNDIRMVGFVGDNITDCHLRLFTDADLASDKLF